MYSSICVMAQPMTRFQVSGLCRSWKNWVWHSLVQTLNFFDPSRQEMKAYAKKSNVPIPNWVMVDRVEDVERVAKRLRFPVLVKPPHGYASVGITRESRCENLEQLKVQTGREIEDVRSRAARRVHRRARVHLSHRGKSRMTRIIPSHSSLLSSSSLKGNRSSITT